MALLTAVGIGLCTPTIQARVIRHNEFQSTSHATLIIGDTSLDQTQFNDSSFYSGVYRLNSDITTIVFDPFLVMETAEREQNAPQVPADQNQQSDCIDAPKASVILGISS